MIVPEILQEQFGSSPKSIVILAELSDDGYYTKNEYQLRASDAMENKKYCL